MLNTYVVYVENKPGVLTRVASLFRRRAFNIDSLTVGRTEKPEVSRMTITVDADHDQARRIEANGKAPPALTRNSAAAVATMTAPSRSRTATDSFRGAWPVPG